MKIGILQTGGPPEPLKGYGSYGEMFERLLGPGYQYRTYDVPAGELPADPRENDAYIVTGSAAGVYDPLPWIEPLKAFLRAAKGQAALVGVCFGHQVMAEAFGGRVEKSPKGWAVGLHTYAVTEREPWMDDAATIAVPASHQDQVVQPPPNAEVFAASDFTPYGALAYTDQPAISIQLHPEFEPAYATALIENRRGTRFTAEQADAGVESLKRPDDRARVGEWIRRFLVRNSA